MKFNLVFTSVMICLGLSVSAQTGGKALSFDGTDDHVVCSLPNVFTDIASNDITIELWVNQTTPQFCRLVYAQFDVDNFVSVSLNSTNEVVFYLMENSINHSIQSSTTIASGTLTHIAVTWTAPTQESHIFINGIEALYEPGVFISSTATNNTMTIGSRTDGNQVFSGVMDELTIWDVTREECELNLNRNDKRHGNETNVVSYYNFDQGIANGSNPTVTVLPDLTTNANNGTLNNFALSGMSSNWITSGVQIFGWIENQVSLGQTGSNIYPFSAVADQYQWIKCNTGAVLVGATNANMSPLVEDPNYSGSFGDSYAVILSFGNCVDTSDCFIYITESINELSSIENLTIYPNPSNGSFYVELPDDAKEIQILSLSAELIARFTPNGQTVMQIDLPNLNGMYFVRVRTESGVVSSKISIENN